MDVMALRELSDFVDIPSVRVMGYRKEVDRFEIDVELEWNSAVCPSCGVRSSHKHAAKPVAVRDLPCFGRPVYLVLPRRQFKCRHCSKPFTERLTFVDFGSSFTKRYEQYIYEQSHERSFTVVGNQERISDTVIRKVYDSYASRDLQPRGRPKTIRVLGIDEISTRKGHRHFVCVITDIDRKRVVEVLENRLKDTVIEIQRGMPKNERDELKGLRWILVTNEANLDDEQKAKLKELYTKSPELKTCHKLKEEFRDIFETEKARSKAARKLQAWKSRVRRTGLKSFEGFLTTLDNWEEWILNYFSSGKITNGVVEGINNKIKLIKRRAYGYRNNGNFRQRILVECGEREEQKSGV